MYGKDEVRKKLKIKRRYFSGVRREFADGCISDNFLSAYSAFNSFFIYNSFTDEADTQRIIKLLSEAGKEVYLPRVEGENMVAVKLGQLQKGAFGIYEPCGQAFDKDIDVTVIPLLAVNERGYRVGYGKGFYDRYLKNKRTLKVGLGYFFQTEDFKEDEWDVKLDTFVCEKGIYYYGIDT